MAVFDIANRQYRLFAIEYETYPTLPDRYVITDSFSGGIVMKRAAMSDLERWAKSPKRKPLVVTGARQVGKTWLVLEFGREHFDAVAHVTFLDNEVMKNVFAGSLDPARLLTAISAYTGTDASNGRTLVFFDEIQECPRAIASLKQFCELRPDIPVVAAGSLLGVAMSRLSSQQEDAQRISWPVGKVDYLDMHPMTFKEFVEAMGEPRLSQLLGRDSLDLASALGEKYEDLLKLYLYVGGMPEAVQAYIDTHLLGESRKVQQRLLRDYEFDFSKHVSAPADSERIREVWRSVPTQISRETGINKFAYSKVKAGGRGREYRDAVSWLVDAGLVTRVPRVSRPGIPLLTYADDRSFKLFLLDVGLLGAAYGLDQDVIVRGDSLYAQGKGAYAEQYVCQQLVASNACVPYYWSADGRTDKAEVDFVYECRGKVIPLEVKSDDNVRSRSLAKFSKEFGIIWHREVPAAFSARLQGRGMAREPASLCRRRAA